jgi:hypothetical protein
LKNSRFEDHNKQKSLLQRKNFFNLAISLIIIFYYFQHEDASNISRTTTVTSSSKSTSHSGGSKTNAYVALFDYTARTDRDLSFKKCDILQVNEDDKKTNGWWLATLEGKRGYIPSSYVARLDSIDSKPWYFASTKRMEAEKLLMMDQNSHGSFLIRISDANGHAYSLSVRDQDTVSNG